MAEPLKVCGGVGCVCKTEAGVLATFARGWVLGAGAGWLADSGGRRHLCGRLRAAERELEGQEELVRFEEGVMRGERLSAPSLGHLPSAYPFPDPTNILLHHLPSIMGLSPLYAAAPACTPVHLGLGG